MSTPAATASAGGSRLQALPVELVQRIADYLPDESLLQLRQSCKTLEIMVFDYFIEAYVAHQTCWIYGEQRLSRVCDMIGSDSRLANRIRSVRMTVDVLEGHQLRDLDTVACVGERRTDLKVEQCIQANELMLDTPPAIATISRTLAEIKSRGCLLQLDFAGLNDSGHYGRDNLPVNVHRDILFQVAATNTPVQSLVLAPSSFLGLGDIDVQHWIAKATRSVESVRYETFSWLSDWYLDDLYEEPEDGQQEDIGIHNAAMILGSIPNLLELQVSIKEIRNFVSSQRIGSNILLANGLERLTSLELSHVFLNPNDLLAALQRCKSSLTRLEFVEFGLTGPADS